MVPFEWDVCIFRKLRKLDPICGNPQDDLLLVGIRRMNLDSFWSRAPYTVKGNRDRLAVQVRLSELMGLEGPSLHNGPYPDYDHVGYEVALEMLLLSRQPGRNSEPHLQFDTIGKLQSTYANQFRWSPQSTRTVLASGDQKGRYLRFASDPCASMLVSSILGGLPLSNGAGMASKPSHEHSFALGNYESNRGKDKGRQHPPRFPSRIEPLDCASHFCCRDLRGVSSRSGRFFDRLEGPTR